MFVVSIGSDVRSLSPKLCLCLKEAGFGSAFRGVRRALSSILSSSAHPAPEYA